MSEIRVIAWTVFAVNVALIFVPPINWSSGIAAFGAAILVPILVRK